MAPPPGLRPTKTNEHTMTKNHTRPGVISSRGFRKAYEGSRWDSPLFRETAGVLDGAQLTFDGLIAVRESASPLKTREANAVALRASVQKAVEITKAKITSRREAFVTAMLAREAGAYRSAGVVDMPGAEEVRSALRAMTPKERDSALGEAIKRGDKHVISAIHFAPSPVTTGAFSAPVSNLIEQYVREQNPGYSEEMTDMVGAINHLDIVAEAFSKGADDLRDRVGEAAADEGTTAAAEAQKKLSGALGVVVPDHG